MNKHHFILPVIMLLCVLFLGSYAVSNVHAEGETPAIDQLNTEASALWNSPTGSAFSKTFSADLLTQAAQEGLQKYEAEIKAAIKEQIKVDVNLANPKVEFSAGGFKLSIKVGYGIFKVGASVNGTVDVINGLPSVTITEVNVPIIKLDKDSINSQFNTILSRYGQYLLKYVTFSKVETTDGNILIEGVKN